MIITDQLAKITSQPRGSLGFSALFALAFALWSSSAAMQTLMTGLNVVYGEEERRGVIEFYATALGLTFGGIVSALLSLSLVAALPAVLKFLWLPKELETIVLLVRWPLLGLAVMIGLAVLYRFGPSREKPRWQWVRLGGGRRNPALAASAPPVLLVRVELRQLYETYGALGAGRGPADAVHLSAYSRAVRRGSECRDGAQDRART